MAKLRLLWESSRSSLWFVPTILVLSAVVLAQGLIEIDRHIDQTNLREQWPRLFGAGEAVLRIDPTDFLPRIGRHSDQSLGKMTRTGRSGHTQKA